MPQELSDLHAWNSKPGCTNVNGRSQYTGEPSIGDLPTMVEQSTHIASNYAFRLPRQCCPQHCLSMQWIGDDMNHRRVGYVEIHRRPPLCVVVKVITRKWPVAWLLAPRTGLMEPSTADRETKSAGDLLVVTHTVHHPPYPLKEDLFSTGVLSNILLS